VNFDGNSKLSLNVTANVSEANTITDGTATSINLIKAGTSTLTLSGNNSYSGGTTLSAGTLSVGSATAIPSTGTISFNGGTIQSSDATLRTLSNVITVNSGITVGTTGNLTFSNTGSVALGATRTFTINGGTTTFAQAFSGSTYGITKAGAGTLTLTGANTFTGTTTINAGTIVLNNDGDVTSSTVLFNGNSTGLTITGGTGVTSIWNNNGGNFGNTGTSLSNVQVLIDGAGTAGSARITNVNLLLWGGTMTSSTLTLTNGGQMTVNGEIRTGNPYYSTAGGANITIGGGTATSTFTGNNQAFFIGYGDREGSNNNIVTVSSGGVLTSIGNMFVGHVNNAQGNDQPSTANRLTVTGTGTASMTSITIGYAQNADNNAKANANVVEVTNGGQLTTSAISYIGRANANLTTANNNTLTVSGTGSSWNAGNQTVYVGYASGTGVSTGNMLTVGTGGVLTNLGGLVLRAANTFFYNSADAMTMSCVISGGGVLIKDNTGTLSLSNANSYSGGSTITGGTLQFTKLTAMPASGAVTVNTGAALGINAGGAGEWTTGTSGNGTIGGLLAGLGGQAGGTVSYSGNVTLALDTTNAGGAQTYAGVIGNVGTALGLTKLGTGTLILNQANTYTGATAINGGTLALGANGVFADTMPLSISNATLDVATFTDTVGTLDVAGTATINLGTGAALAFDDSNAIEWTGGTLTLTGTFVSGASLRFGSTSGGLTGTQLALISMSGWKNFALNSNGYLTADEAVSPTVQNVTSAKANGTYNSGEVIDVTVQFSETVNVTGAPRLTLETGDTDRTANYISGSGSATLTFRYTVVLGDASTDLDYTGTGSLALNGGTIRDAALNAAILLLPDPSAANSLGGNKALVIFTSVGGSTFRFR